MYMNTFTCSERVHVKVGYEVIAHSATLVIRESDWLIFLPYRPLVYWEKKCSRVPVYPGLHAPRPARVVEVVAVVMLLTFSSPSPSSAATGNPKRKKERNVLFARK